ncbi:MAG TPA: DUF4093 domain-containing protein [Candidatus Scatovicinus merdipullorum]|nr:DUF4093 domain-containing protein [Candidatus Scatovicinus merdipullorum]
MVKIRQAIIVEGRYDKIRLQSIVDAPIIETNGFRIFKDKEKVHLIRCLAEKRGILILTDSDGAGFVIRNYLKGVVPEDSITHAYLPSVQGKEKRKTAPSKEGLLGVEGFDKAHIIRALKNSGAVFLDEGGQQSTPRPMTKADLFALGLTGGKNSAQKRRALLQKLQLPQYLSVNAILEYLNCLYTKEELVALLNEQNL